ncbi:hypothetical protein AB0I06_26515 [Streptomyces sp. NPDC050674]|uniref:hypothetical protein n=1 Tax=Streptomyces sp. NPDC050674 TaxID=3157216 RepID=UPI00343BD0A5
MADPKLQLAYQTLVDELKVQTATLADFRSRATTMFSVAALIATLSTGVGFVEKGETLAPWAPWVLLGVLTAVGAASMAVLWPTYPWWFVPSAGHIMARYRAGKDEDATLQDVIRDLTGKVRSNATVLTRRSLYLRIGFVLFFVEIATLIIAAGTP